MFYTHCAMRKMQYARSGFITEMQFKSRYIWDIGTNASDMIRKNLRILTIEMKNMLSHWFATSKGNLAKYIITGVHATCSWVVTACASAVELVSWVCEACTSWCSCSCTTMQQVLDTWTSAGPVCVLQLAANLTWKAHGACYLSDRCLPIYWPAAQPTRQDEHAACV